MRSIPMQEFPVGERMVQEFPDQAQFGWQVPWWVLILYFILIYVVLSAIPGIIEYFLII